MTLTNLFLKAKHWHLFALTIGIPLGFQFIMMVMVLAGVANGAEIDSIELTGFIIFFPVLMILFTATLFGWIWSVVTGLQCKIPLNILMETSKFKWFFFIPLAYTTLLHAYISITLAGVFETAGQGGEPDIRFIAGMMAFIIPLHLFSIFCIFYCLYFVAKTIKTAELQRETAFSDFVGEFFLIWFFPIGIWFIQPRVNQLADSSPDMMG
jgi:hypothetical protein